MCGMLRRLLEVLARLTQCSSFVLKEVDAEAVCSFALSFQTSAGRFTAAYRHQHRSPPLAQLEGGFPDHVRARSHCHRVWRR